MKPEEQRIAIAEACGWKPERTWLLAPNRMYGERPEDGCYMPLPDYLNDLNACHKMEDNIVGSGLAGSSVDVKYHKQLAAICSTRPIWNATAAQRAEAFLKTLSLWKDDD